MFRMEKEVPQPLWVSLVLRNTGVWNHDIWDLIGVQREEGWGRWAEAGREKGTILILDAGATDWLDYAP